MTMITYAPNPILSQGTWEETFPPIKSSAQYLINKYTGDIVFNTIENAMRSDVYQPYLGTLPQHSSDVEEMVINDTAVASHVNTSEELAEL